MSRQPGRQRCARQQRQRRRGHRRKVPRVKPEEQAFGDARGEQGSHHAQEQAGRGRSQRLAQDRPHHLPPTRSQRHAHADLRRSLRDPVGESAVDAEAGQDQRQGGEGGDEPREEGLLTRRQADLLGLRPRLEDRHASVERGHLAPQRRQQREGVALGPHRERHHVLPVLAIGQVEGGRRGLAKGGESRVAGQADHFHPLVLVEAERLSHGVARRQVPFRQSLVDDGHGRSAFAVLPGQVAAAQEGDAHRLEVARRHVVDGDAEAFLASRHTDAVSRPVGADQSPSRRRRGPHAGQRGRPRHRLLVEIVEPRLLVAAQRGVHLEQQEVLRREAEGLAAQVDQRTDEEAGAHQEHQRQGNLDRHQDPARPEPRDAVDGAGGRAREQGQRLQPRGPQRRRQATQEAGSQAGGGGESQQPEVGLHVQVHGLRSLRESGGQHVAQEDCQDGPDASADNGEEQALGHQLARQPGAARSQGQAGAQLALACRRPGEHQPGDVRAGDEQDGARHRHQDAERLAETPSQAVEAVASGVQREARRARGGVFPSGRVGQHRLPEQGLGLDTRRLVAPSRPQTTHHTEAPAARVPPGLG